MNIADQTRTNTLSPEVWLTSVFLLISLIIGINLIFQWRMDVFGILRDPHGRYLVTSHHEPKAKYLLNRAYVPANFDALVIGASASENWDLSRFTGYRFYNESIEGGNRRLFLAQNVNRRCPLSRQRLGDERTLC